MTQDSDRRPSTSKRAARAGRNRPVLVTPQELQEAEASKEQSAPDTAEVSASTATSSSSVENGKSREVSEPKPRTRVLPRFFSSVGKSTEVEKPKVAVDTNRARLARAIRGKTAAPPKDERVSESAPKPKPKPVATRTTTPPARTGFRSRHIMGLLLYLLISYTVGIGLTYVMTNFHLNVLLTSFTIPGINLPVVLTSSTVAYLVVLVVVLVVLTRFDLMPRFTGSAPAKTSTKSTRTSSERDEDGDRLEGTPSYRQGIKGADDDLYQEYRERQRYTQRRQRRK